MNNLFEFKTLNQKGEEVSLNAYAGKVVLVVNTATGCGFTPQYKGLEELYEKYKDQGFVILDFPCNQFLNQAPGSDDEIHEFCTLNYHVSFPQFKKSNVNGDNENPIYTFLKSEKKGKIKWNFEKFLVGKDGHVVDRFGSMTKPEKLENKIVELLNS